MAITKQTTLDQIEITRNGTVQIRIALELVEGGAIISQKWHRTSIQHDGDFDAQMAAVNAHLAQMGERPVSHADIEKIKSHQI